MDKLIKIAVKQQTRKFLKERISGIEELRLENIELNPFLIASIKNQFGMKKQKDLAMWMVNQRIERGTVTAFGGILQKIAKEFTNEVTTPGFTMTLKKNGKKYNIVVTSGPNPYAKQQAVDFVNRMMESKKTDPGSIPILGMCYGNNDVLSSIIKSKLKEIKYLVGKEFWEFISGDKNCRDEIIKTMYDTANQFQDLEKRNVNKVRNKKINEFEEALQDRFGKNPNKFWENLFRDIYI